MSNMQKVFFSIIIACALLTCMVTRDASGATIKRFNEGPYILLGGGVLNFSRDRNVRTGNSGGDNWEPCIGLNFGWNIIDAFAVEAQIRYFTSNVRNSREHLLMAGVNAVYNVIIPSWVAGDVKFIPIIHAGMLAELAAIPGDETLTPDIIFSAGPGFSTGAGLRIMFLQYGFAGILIQDDIVYMPSQTQTVGGIRQKIISGGWDMQLGFLGQIGVHF